MASIRTARVLAFAAALPLVVAVGSGVAAADNGAIAGSGSDAAVATVGAAGVGGVNTGNSSTTQQQAVGTGASNQNNSVQLDGPAVVPIHQSNQNFAIHFSQLW
ncbi:hypothetical protein [Streptomyces sp. NPDC058045]|uniref:hypothetical protein n=1 Tax=Streptomyces sp. NPDC058045 TaxID=3346311 RepID=UPI0036EE8571